MGAVSTYLNTIEGDDRAALERVYTIAHELVPEAKEGTSYAMAALYRGKGLVATVRAKKFLAIYPFSGSVIAANLDVFTDFKTTSRKHPLLSGTPTTGYRPAAHRAGPKGRDSARSSTDRRRLNTGHDLPWPTSFPATPALDGGARVPVPTTTEEPAAPGQPSTP